MTPDPAFDPLQERPSAVARLLAAREAGATLRQAAAAAGVHVATVCRWARCSHDLADALRAAERAARTADSPPGPRTSRADPTTCRGIRCARSAGPMPRCGAARPGGC